MAQKVVTYYTVSHAIGGTTDVFVVYEDGKAETIPDLPIAEARHVIDLLRNEKPISYDHERKRLSTESAERVGEAEGS